MVDCVNACAGLNPEHIPALVEAAQAVRSDMNLSNVVSTKTERMLRDALSAIEDQTAEKQQ